MKKFICVILSALALCAFAFGGCFNSTEQVSRFEVSVDNTYTEMTDEQWQEYKQILEENGTAETSLQASINYSLLSGVSILSRFEYNDLKCYVAGSFGGSTSAGTPDYHVVYCGSGVIVQLDKVKGDAYVITNCHVVCDDSSKQIISDDVRLYLYGQDAERINYNVDKNYVYKNGKQVFYKEDGNEYYLMDYGISGDEKYRIPATVVGASVTYDIALLKIENSSVLRNSGAVTAKFAESDEVYAGERVYAVGNPEGDGMSATVGFISKESEDIALNVSEKNENDYGIYRVIRTDAAVNGGNSGGGMYNARGELVGIINSKNAAEEIDNMAYALPASNVKRLWKVMKEAYEGGNSYFKKTDPFVKVALFPAEYQVISSSSHLNNGYAEIVQTMAVSRSGGNFLAGDILKSIKITDGSGKTVEERTITRTYHIDDTLLSARDGYTVTFTVARGFSTTQVSYTASLVRSDPRK